MQQRKTDAEVALELMRLVLDQAGSRRLSPTRTLALYHLCKEAVAYVPKERSPLLTSKTSSRSFFNKLANGWVVVSGVFSTLASSEERQSKNHTFGCPESYFWRTRARCWYDKIRSLDRKVLIRADITPRKEARMMPLRMRVLMVLVMMLMVLPFATSAHADGFGAAEDLAYYLCQYYLSCW